MKLAALDVGTNTVLMLVVERTADGRINTLADMSRITRLGRGVDASGALDPEAIERTLDAIAEFAEKARSLGAEKILTAATSASRDAKNGPEFLAAVKARAGLDLEIISGEDEARLSYLATVKSLQLDPASKILIVDIGGGSTELIRAQPGRKLEVISLQIGSVRLTERLIHHDPPQAREAAELRLAADEALRNLGWEYQPDALVGIAGTVTTICAVALGMEKYDAAVVHGHRLTEAQVLETIGRLGAVPLEERKRIPGMEPGRADVIFAGAAILERVMAHFHAREVIVSDRGVRWGLVWRELEGSDAV
jgi:exopolyphosphatase/guanosine-5'-triphosphate,3'-diphosphate pyrophosphatase